MENRQLKTIEYKYDSDSAQLGFIRKDLKSALLTEISDPDDLDSVVFAVNEACMNIVQHADNGDYKGAINIAIKVDDKKLSFTIDDDARPADFETFRFEKADELSPGGLGLFFINEIMDDVEYAHKEASNGNILLMTKVLK